MDRILETIDNINEWTGKVCCWMIAVLTLLVVQEVIMRRFFGHPTIWNFEVTKQLYGFHFMILAGYALLHKSHVSIDIIERRFSERTKAVIALISYSLFFFPFWIVVLWQGIKFASKSWAVLETSWSTFAPPLYPIKSVIAATAFLLLLQGSAVFIRMVIAATGKRG